MASALCFIHSAANAQSCICLIMHAIAITQSCMCGKATVKCRMPIRMVQLNCKILYMYGTAIP